MKRLLLVPLIFFLGSCSYGSRHQAMEACLKWAKEGGTIKTYFSDKLLRRKCKVEKETRKVIGQQNMAVKKGAIYKKGEYSEESKVIKLFKY